MMKSPKPYPWTVGHSKDPLGTVVKLRKEDIKFMWDHSMIDYLGEEKMQDGILYQVYGSKKDAHKYYAHRVEDSNEKE